jgi:hypothetical protein
MSNRVVLLVPDGVGVRNFVLGPFLAAYFERTGPGSEIHVLHTVPPEVLATYRCEPRDRIHWHALDPFRDRPLAMLQRNSLAFAQTYWVDTHAMRITRNRPVSGPLRSRAAMRAAKGIGRLAASARGIRLLDSLHCRYVAGSPDVARYRTLFEEIRPDVLLCSHQRPPIILAPVIAARQLGIPAATFIFSWDNITSKGRIAAPFDHFLVWSDLMRRELLTYYPDVSEERVHVVGTPQFDPYANPSLLRSREAFCRQIGADPARPLICFSGGDAGNAPQDPGHLAVLMQLIENGSIRGNPHVVLRPMPGDSRARYQHVLDAHPAIIYASPKWVSVKSHPHPGYTPLRDDVDFLANLTHHSDLNVNFASTMTLDFSIHDRPVVNLAFDVDGFIYGESLWDYQRKFDHYRPVIEFGAARFARSRQELADHINAYLANPGLDREGRRNLVELQVSGPLGGSSDRIAGLLQTLNRARARTAAA